MTCDSIHRSSAAGDDNGGCPLPGLELQQAIDLEFELNDRRVNAMLVFHGLLFAAIGLVVRPDSEVLKGLLLPIAGVGAAAAFLAMLSLCSGTLQIRNLKMLREAKFPERAVYGAASNSLVHFGGILPYIGYPILLMLAWLVLFIANL